MLMVEQDDLKDQLENIEKKAQRFMVISVLEFRINMVEDVQEKKADAWDKVKWEQALSKLKGGERVLGQREG